MSLDLTPQDNAFAAPTAITTARHRPLMRRLGSRGPVEYQPTSSPVLRSDAIAGPRTALALAPLRNVGWSITHDIRARRVTIEHLAVGLGGTFALAARSTPGTVRIVGDQVSIAGAGGETFSGDDWAHEAREHAAEANKLLSTSLAQRVPVSAVVVVWGDFPQRRVEGHNVTFVHGDELAAWLKSRPVRCGAGRVAELEAALRSEIKRAS